MGNLIGFEGYLNRSAPFSSDEYKTLWKEDREYVDFRIGNEWNETCPYPRFWNETGYPVEPYVDEKLDGCYDSDFDQFGDIEAFGVHPNWKRQLAKFASVQDRLREWHPSVRNRLTRHWCNIIRSLDIDGFRFDKATQATVDPLADMASIYRDCAREIGKHNFFMAGEITSGNTFGSIYLGRGRQPNMVPKTISQAYRLTNTSSPEYFLRGHNHQALDAAAFHYSIYRSLTRILGMDGNLEAGYDTPVDFTDAWYEMLLTNDFVNANTGEFDPRHMYGVTNQDVFRWPAIRWGVDRNLLGMFITTLHLPGIPLLLWGEEQAFYILDATASNYLYGRAPMSPATAWKTHGCFSLNSTQYYNWPLEAGSQGCHDETVTYDHRDPSHPVRNILKQMYQMREQFPVLNDGWNVLKLSNLTQDVYYPGSGGVPTPTGMWSILRGRYAPMQDFGHGNQSVWLVYQNVNRTVQYNFNCNSNETALVSPYPSGTTVKNLFYPYDELTLKDGPVKLGLEGSDEFNGCLDNLILKQFEFRAYVPKHNFTLPRPMVTKISPGHDAPLRSQVGPNESEDIPVTIYFSQEMDCDSITKSISFISTTEFNQIPSIKQGSVNCGRVSPGDMTYSGQIPSAWGWSAEVTGVYNGHHRLTLNNATSADGNTRTNAIDHFSIRIGQLNNPMVSTHANYSESLVHQKSDGTLYVEHHAPGATMWRYSTNWGTTFSQWLPYKGGNSPIQEQPWSGTKAQEWKGKHVRVEYWSKLTGSSDYVQEGDLSWGESYPRRFPHLFFNGPYNQWGYDAGLDNVMKQDNNGTWTYRFMAEWPAEGQVNVWGMDPDGHPDRTHVFGDVDNDSVLDRMPPSSLESTVVNITNHPPYPYVAWRMRMNDATLRFELLPTGSSTAQLVLYILLWIVPILTGAACVYAFMKSFYQIKFNKFGVREKKALLPLFIRRKLRNRTLGEKKRMNPLMRLANKSGFLQSTSAFGTGDSHKRTILIATMEYDIEDWAIKIKIGGLGVMAQLMGKHLGHQNLIWVVPCVGGIDYPEDQPAESMIVMILGNPYEVKVQYHVLKNITYVLLDAPVFRQQSKAEPYPARMDDLDSAIYYSAWNQCIAQAIQRFPVELYHINDYHGSIAPLYLLPQSVPICLSLHNAEFQGLWPMRTQKEKDEVCSIFNLDNDTAHRYVQFGEVFNLLHAGASYLRVHQQGFGAVGVSKKYGKRSYARYPIFWGLKKVGNLPNPDPADTGEWNKELPKETDITVDPNYEAGRGDFKRQAQEWAGLEVKPDAELLVFVGRWSMQKGVDLIADVMPAVLDARPKVQLICVGPVIDLYGKFAALKLDRMMKLYPGRVFSRPQFTTLPPFIFSGAEFALIPSRDEPFGLVAVEFGRKGALGIGARVGGLGQMPGWWYNVESTSTTHLLSQFKSAIGSALNSRSGVRAQMRARSAKQRFPVAQWVEDLEILQSTSIRIHSKKANGQPQTPSGYYSPSGFLTPPVSSSGPMTPTGVHTPPFPYSRDSSISTFNRFSAVGPQQRNTIIYSRDPSPGSDDKPKPGLVRQLSLGVRSGPGHGEGRGRRKLRKSNIPDHEDNPFANMTDDESDDDTFPAYYPEDEYTLSPDQVDTGRRLDAVPPARGSLSINRDLLSLRHSSQSSTQARSVCSLAAPSTTMSDDTLVAPMRPFSDLGLGNRLSTSSALSVDTIVGEKRDYKLQKVDPNFTDSSGEYYRKFEKKLESLNGSNSESQLCIEEYIVKSEKKFFDDFREARLGRIKSPTASYQPNKHDSSPVGSYFNFNDDSSSNVIGSLQNKEADNEFFLGDDYVPPTGLKKWMLLRIGDWPVYSLFLALGQIIAANSYQITLLTGQVGETAEKLYAIATVYLVTSIIWWFAFRYLKSVIVLSVPWLLYGLAFLIIGLAHFEPDLSSRAWIQNVGSAVYAAASSSGSIFFSLNFGDESSAPVKKWVFRACLIQGTQQAYVIALWYWGSVLAQASASGVKNVQGGISDTWKIRYVSLTVLCVQFSLIPHSATCVPIALLLWVIGLLVFFGLPSYYRQTPGKVPSFYKSVFRRKIVLWNLVVVVVQNFFLSAPYGRNWSCECNCSTSK